MSETLVSGAAPAGGDTAPEVTPLGEGRMVREDCWREVHRLFHVERRSKSEIARQLALDRKTVRGILREAAWQPYVRAERIDTLLAEHARYLQTRAPQVQYSARILFQELRQARGYRGSYETVKRCVRPLRAVEQAAERATVRFETPPGQQAQVDFAEFRLPWGKRYALVVVLSYSRLLWLQFYARQTMAVLTRGLEEAFAAFGGVPAELLFDQMKAVICEDQREIGGRLLENPEFVRFAAHWDFRIRACRPYRAKTKGKVERPIGYVRQSFFYGRTFLNDADLNAQALAWLAQTANVRIHRTTREVPHTRFERDERVLLKALAVCPYRSLLLPATIQPALPQNPVQTNVERRPLAWYGQLTGVTP